MNLNSINGILANLTPLIAQWWTPIEMIAYLAGFILIASGLVRLAYAHRGREGVYGGLLRIIAGILLLNLPEFLNVLTVSVFSQPSPTSALEYAPPNGATNGIMRFIVVAVEIIGLVGVLRGLVLLAGAGSEPRNVGRAITHIVAGIAAVNITQLLSVIGQSAGSSVNSIIHRFIT